tara:strand:- start:1279 stop:2322 length:1044 start_codon:yes stop_codon:yes gene_type:complete
MAVSEGDLESALFLALGEPKFQKFLQSHVELKGAYEVDDIRTQYPRKSDAKGRLDIHSKFRKGNKFAVIGIELKTPQNSADSDQLSRHLQTLKLKGKNWQKKAEAKNMITKYLVISKGFTIDKSVNEIKQKASWKSVIYWLSWNKIRDFIDSPPKKPAYEMLRKRLKEAGVIDSSETLSANIQSAKRLANAWDEKMEDITQEIDKIGIGLSSLEFELHKKEFETVDARSTKSPYSFSVNHHSKLPRWIYKEFKHPKEQDFNFLFGMKISTGKWSGSLVPKKLTKTSMNNINKKIKKHKTKSTRVLQKKVWAYNSKSQDLEFDGWHFETNRSPKTVSRFVLEMFGLDG